MSTLSFGGLYVSSYGDNDRLVNVWSSKLPCGIHLFTDSKYDPDNIRTGSAVFSRIESYLRSASTAGVTSLSKQPVDEEENISTCTRNLFTAVPYRLTSGLNSLFL